VRKISGSVLGLVILFTVMALVPLGVGEYHLNIMTLVLVFLIVTASYRLLATTGEISLSHVVIMGIGAYTSALLSRYPFSLPFWATVFIGAMVAVGFAYATAYPLFRMKGFYFVLGSFAMGEAVRLSWQRWTIPFGGTKGIPFLPSPSLGGFIFSTPVSYYYLTLGITVGCMAAMYLINISRIGKAMVAIHSQDDLCESMGINVFHYKRLAYVTASFFAGIAGAVLAHYLLSVNPSQFSLAPMFFVLVWVVVGGMNTYWGPIIGVLLLIPIQEVLRGHFVQYTPMIFGIILIAMVFALPGGLESLPQRISEWRRARREKAGAT